MTVNVGSEYLAIAQASSHRLCVHEKKKRRVNKKSSRSSRGTREIAVQTLSEALSKALRLYVSFYVRLYVRL